MEVWQVINAIKGSVLSVLFIYFIDNNYVTVYAKRRPLDNMITYK